MATLARRVRTFLLCGSQATTLSPPDEGAKVMVREVPATNQGPVFVPKALHESQWLGLPDLDKNLNFRPGKADLGGPMILLLLGSPGIGKKSLANKVLFCFSL